MLEQEIKRQIELVDRLIDDLIKSGFTHDQATDYILGIIEIYSEEN